MAAPRAGAAADKAADHRILGLEYAFSHEPMGCCFRQRLRDPGWIEGRTVAIEYRWMQGRSERAAEIATEFVRLNVDVIVTYASVAVLAAKQATSVIPIVFAAATDAVGAGLVASLARPGGNVTGLSLQQTDAAGKRLALLRVSKLGTALHSITSSAVTSSLSGMCEGDAFRGAAFHGDLPAARPSAEEALARAWDATASSRIGEYISLVCENDPAN